MGQKKDKKQNENSGLGLRGLMYHNGFILVCCFLVSVVVWFVMAAGSDMNRTTVIKDVPVSVSLSSQAEAEGLRVFAQSYNTVDIEVSGSSMITRALTAEDFEVSVTLNPVSTKLTGNTTQKYSAQVRFAKRNAQTDYQVVSVTPEEITLEYDRYKETVLNIENELTYTAATGFYPGTPVLSVDTVNVSGPESAVNKVARAAVSYSAPDPLWEYAEWHCPVQLYDQNNQELINIGELYLSQDVEAVQVTVPVNPKKSVPLVANYTHAPSGFSSSRITVEPASIELTGSSETLDAITEIRLDSIIDFAELDLDQRTASFTMEIPIPPGTRDITNSGTANTVSQATVSVNLNGYRKTTLTVPESNIKLLNPPTGNLEAALTSRTIEVTVAGTEAQVARLSGDSVTVQVDMSNFDGRPGTIDVPAIVAVSGTAGENCWVLGSYTVAVTVQEASARSAAASAALAAAPPSF